MRAAARRGEASNYSIAFSLGGRGPAEPKPSEAAGPPRWQVGGLSRGDTLTVRTGPGYSNPVVLRFDEGAVVRNFGCEESSGARWCRIGPPEADAPAGWAAGRFLREAAADPTVAGSRFQATGELACRLPGREPGTCPFGVRRSAGQAQVEVTLPGGGKRTLLFQGSRVSTAERMPVVASREGDGTIVTVNGAERFVVPDIVLRGD
ncbi:SH3 domain-containing protein [Roseococcus sp. YIM B11640]|uniref:SH3 domain-containing protein n=1 Tax=Roseococcus sp. YIM B11640 TaxID=3133973 RepID=UPI003C79B68A